MTKNTTASKIGTALLRILAGITGAAIIGCVTWANVTASGGLLSATAPSLIAHAVGLVIGAACVGVALRCSRYVLGGLIAIMLITGEAYTLLNTSERELESRELRQTPNKMADAKRKAIEAEIAKAEAALAGLTSHRLSQAQQVLGRIELSSIEASTKKDCWKLCKQRLDDSVASARQDVEAARAELNAERAGILAKIEARKAEIAAVPVVAALSPLAARTGIQDWKLDLIRAGLFTFSMNGLGGFLMVFAAHGRRRESFRVSDSVQAQETKALSFENEKGDRPDPEIEEIIRILTGRKEPVTNDQLARLMRVQKSEASKRNLKAHNAGIIDKWKEGKFTYMKLRDDALVN